MLTKTAFFLKDLWILELDFSFKLTISITFSVGFDCWFLISIQLLEVGGIDDIPWSLSLSLNVH